MVIYHFDILAQREDNWDGHGSPKPTDLTVAHAKVVIDAFLDSVISTGHRCDTPSISSDEDGDVTVAWYEGERQLHHKVSQMRTPRLSFITLFLTLSLLLPNAPAQDHTTFGLPDGATMRLGKGRISGNIAFSPDGKTIVTGGWDSTVRLWSAYAGRHKAALRGHTAPVHSVVYSPDGKIIATASADDTIRLWNATTRKHRTTLSGHTRSISAIAYSLDGGTIASISNDGTILLWDIR